MASDLYYVDDFIIGARLLLELTELIINVEKASWTLNSRSYEVTINRYLHLYYYYYYYYYYYRYLKRVALQR